MLGVCVCVWGGVIMLCGGGGLIMLCVCRGGLRMLGVCVWVGGS